MKNDVKATWYEVDAAGQVLGRLATEVSSLLLGKHLPQTRPNMVPPVEIVIKNTDGIRLTGNKENAKVYYRHSGYPGGLKQRTFKEQKEIDSTRIVRMAVEGMLPKNNLRKERMRHLRLFAGAEHPHTAQIEK